MNRRSNPQGANQEARNTFLHPPRPTTGPTPRTPTVAGWLEMARRTFHTAKAARIPTNLTGEPLARESTGS